MPLGQTIVLPDRRLLSYDDLGDPEGVPVVFLHGVPGSRRYWSLTGPCDVASEQGVRLIALDRPGVGRSSPAPHRRVVDHAGDIEALVDALEVDRFALLAFSGGAAYALSTAIRLADRVAAVGLVSPVCDLSVPTLYRGLDPLTRRALKRLAETPARAWHLPDRFDSGKLLVMATDKVWALLPAADRRVLSRPRVRKAATRMLEEAARHGMDGVGLDARLLVEPWEFDLPDVDAPVDIHVGSADPWSTPEMTHWLRVGLREPRIRTYQGDGHFTVLANRSGDVLLSLIEHASIEVPPARLATTSA